MYEIDYNKKQREIEEKRLLHKVRFDDVSSQNGTENTHAHKICQCRS